MKIVDRREIDSWFGKCDALSAFTPSKIFFEHLEKRERTGWKQGAIHRFIQQAFMKPTLCNYELGTKIILKDEGLILVLQTLERAIIYGASLPTTSS